MTQHLHSTVVPGCYRCELGQDEVKAFTDERRDKLGRWLFERDYTERGLATPDVATWDEYVERNQEQWRVEADAVLAMLDEEGYL